MTERSQHVRRLHLTTESPRPGASKMVVDSEEKEVPLVDWVVELDLLDRFGSGERQAGRGTARRDLLVGDRAGPPWERGRLQEGDTRRRTGWPAQQHRR
jgi:hypothetical protein